MEIQVGKNAGFCYGVKRAVDGAKEVLSQETGPVSCLGELVHNAQVMENLKQHHLEVVEDITKVSHKAIVRAHGISKETYAYAKEHQLELFDFTCPKVAKIHQIVSDFVKDGFFIFLLGNANHPETVATKSFCEGKVCVIENNDGIDNAMQRLKKSQSEKLLLISQTTFSLEKFKQCQELVSKMVPPQIQLVVQNTICPATRMRQEETKEMAQNVDCMIIVGGKNSSNTQKLFAIANTYCPKAICVETVQELSKEMFQNVQRVGIMAGASTPQESIDEIVNFF